nr:PREDICTED: transmembrane protein 135-like [Bemisia tabaci]
MIVHSKFVTIPHTCVEYVHPWTNSCAAASTGLLLAAIPEALRIYITAYTLALLMRGKIPSKKDIKRTILGILQSSAFLTCHAFGYSMVNCLLRRILGHYNFLTVSFLPCFISSIFAILVERPSRRSLLSLYVTNVASETLYRMAVYRGLIRPIQFGEVLIFSLSTSFLLYFFRNQQSDSFRDSIFSLFRFVVGRHEEMNDDKSESSPVPGSSQIRNLNFFDPVFHFADWLKLQTLNPCCPHPFGCAYYAAQGLTKLFAVGYGLQLSLKILIHSKRIMKHPRLLPKIMIRPDTMKLGAFLGGFSFLFRAVSCSLRKLYGRDDQKFAIPAGFLAGFSFFFYRDNTIALYVMWKTFQILYNRGAEKKMLPELPQASVFFHCLSTAILFHAALLEPHNLRPSYWRFLLGMSGERVARMDRKCLDAFGLESSKSLELVLSRTKLETRPVL